MAHHKTILLVSSTTRLHDTMRALGHSIDVSIALATHDTLPQALNSGHEFDLVILDRNMPKMSGLQVLQAIRAAPATAKLKVLVCTAAEMLSEVDEAFAAGATDYIVKPLDFEKLKAKVARHTSPG